MKKNNVIGVQTKFRDEQSQTDPISLGNYPQPNECKFNWSVVKLPIDKSGVARINEQLATAEWNDLIPKLILFQNLDQAACISNILEKRQRLWNDRDLEAYVELTMNLIIISLRRNLLLYQQVLRNNFERRKRDLARTVVKRINKSRSKHNRDIIRLSKRQERNNISELCKGLKGLSIKKVPAKTEKHGCSVCSELSLAQITEFLNELVGDVLTFNTLVKPVTHQLMETVTPLTLDVDDDELEKSIIMMKKVVTGRAIQTAFYKGADETNAPEGDFFENYLSWMMQDG